jgi:hypothetical protein
MTVVSVVLAPIHSPPSMEGSGGSTQTGYSVETSVS